MIITVVGLGVIGGSYIQALHGKGHQVYGIDTDKETLKKDFGTTYIVDYLGSAFGREQVLLETPQNGAKPLIITLVDNDGYAIYNKERSLKENKFIWDYEYKSDSIKAIYNALIERGVITSHNKTLVRK